MSDITDGIGGMVEGGAYGRAVERETGGQSAGGPAKHGHAKGGRVKGGRGHFHETVCLNCGTELIGSHCHNCGQEAHLHRTIGAFFHDLMHGVLHLDGKIWRTLPMLIFKPGKLTRDYIDGQRRRYVSPMAFFLFSVFAMFAVFSMVGLNLPTDLAGSDIEGNAEVAAEQADLRIKEGRAQLETLEPGTPEYEEARQTLEGLVRARGLVGTLGAVAKQGEFDGGIGVPSIDKGIKKWRENPGLMIYKLQSGGYKFSWLLIPLSLPFVWLLFFWKRQFGLYDHSVFVTYSITFMSLLFITASLLYSSGIMLDFVWFMCMVIPIVHIYKQLRYGYMLSRTGALLRTAVMTVFVFIVLLLFLSTLLLLGIFG